MRYSKVKRLVAKQSESTYWSLRPSCSKETSLHQKRLGALLQKHISVIPMYICIPLFTKHLFLIRRACIVESVGGWMHCEWNCIYLLLFGKEKINLHVWVCTRRGTSYSPINQYNWFIIGSHQVPTDAITHDSTLLPDISNTSSLSL